jgi:cytochrome d ubiquinol oxidase subunit I
MVAELGRQPWIVYGVLKTQEAVSPTLNASQALFSLLMFCLIYVLLFSVFIYQMTHKITQGPYLVSEEEDDMGHGKQQIPFVD